MCAHRQDSAVSELLRVLLPELLTLTSHLISDLVTNCLVRSSRLILPGITYQLYYIFSGTFKVKTLMFVVPLLMNNIFNQIWEIFHS